MHSSNHLPLNLASTKGDAKELLLTLCNDTVRDERQVIRTEATEGKKGLVFETDSKNRTSMDKR